MKLITQPNLWTCQPSAYAMCMNTDLEHILQVLGHDGGRIDNFKATSVVWTVSCFTQAEMTLAAYKLGYAAVEVPTVIVNHHRRPVPNYPKTPEALMGVFAPGTRFVLTIRSENEPNGLHCVAYERDADVYYDPLHPRPMRLYNMTPIVLIAAILKLGVTHGPMPYDHSPARGFPTSLD